MPTFRGTIENPEPSSFGVVYQLLDSIFNLGTKLEVFSFKLKIQGAVHRPIKSYVILMGVIFVLSLYSGCDDYKYQI